MEQHAAMHCVTIGTGSGVVIQRILVLAGLFGLGVAGMASTAAAQPYYYGGPRYYGPQYGPPRYYTDGLPPQRIMRAVRYAGFIPISAPARRGPNYVVVATDRNGTQVRVAVNAYEGEVVNVTPIVAMRPPGAMPGGPGLVPMEPLPPRVGMAPQGVPPAMPPRELKDPPPDALPPGDAYNRPSSSIDTPSAPLPPRGTSSSPRLANAPATGPIHPAPAPAARTPIPRPRPNVASSETPAAPAATPPVAGAPTTDATKPADAPTEVAPSAPKPAAPAKSETKLIPVAPLDE
jgi:hypothetical protein